MYSRDFPDNCYITDNYIVTHNTVEAVAAAQLLREWHNINKVLSWLRLLW